MKKKVGICACYATRNYGSMLQAFATQAAIETLGYESEYIVYKKKNTLCSCILQIPRLLNSNLMFDKWMALKKKMLISMHPEVKEPSRNYAQPLSVRRIHNIPQRNVDNNAFQNLQIAQFSFYPVL